MKIIHFADLHLGVETYGHIDPLTGLSSRLIDFLAAFDQMVDYALENRADMVLFCGDAYKNREPTQTQQREFAKRIQRLSSNDIPVFLLAGNHDLPNAVGRATAIEIFGTLNIKNVYISNRPDVYRIPTPSGVIQIVSLPWVRRSALLSKETTKNLNFSELNQKLEQKLADIIVTSVSKLDSALPAILAAHIWITGAQPSSERLMTIGQEYSLLLSNIANPAFDYIALGHIHKHQVLCQHPPVVYSGSLERLNFGEEAGDKGFYVVDIEPNTETSKWQATAKFHQVIGRRFLTIKVDIEPQDINPTLTVVKAISESDIKRAIVRLNINLPAELEGQLHDSDIRNALKEADYFTIAKDIQRPLRLRLGTSTAEEVTPADALKGYLKLQKLTPKRIQTLLDYGERLIQEQLAEPEQ